MQLIHFDCVNGFLNSIKEIVWQTEAIYRCPLIIIQVSQGISHSSIEAQVGIHYDFPKKWLL